MTKMKVALADLCIVGRASDKKTFCVVISKWDGLSRAQNQNHPILEDIKDDELCTMIIILTLKNGEIGMELRTTYLDSYGDNLLEKLWDRYGEGIKISVNLKYATDKNATLSEFASFQGMGIDPKNFVCVGSAVTNSRTFFFHREPKLQLKIDAEVNSTTSYRASFNTVTSDQAVSKQIQESSHPLVSMNRMLLEEGFNSDVTIVAKDNVEIKAHQCFLSVSSPVLRAMFQEWTLESQTRQVEMTDVAENVVRAFLRYIYFRDLEHVRGDAEMAFELFKMAEKYDVQSLKEEMSKILMEIRGGIIKVELAFQMYMFTRNIDSAMEVKAKARGILRANFDEMKALQDFKDLFIESPNVAIEVFGDFAKSA